MASGFTIQVIKPNALDPSLRDHLPRHFVYTPGSNPLGKLLLFLGGTTSRPSNYQNFPAFAAGLGYHVINLSYPNTFSAQVCAEDEDMASFVRFREAVLWGKPGSNHVQVSPENSIQGRLKALLHYLVQEAGKKGWANFVDEDGHPQLDRLVLAGHSQGAGHAAYWAKHQLVPKVLLFAGPNDYSHFHQNAATWLTQPGITPKAHFQGILHRRDEIIPVTQQLATWQAMGLVKDEGDLGSLEDEYHQEAHSFWISDREPLADQVGIAPYHSVMVADSRAVRAGNQAPEMGPIWQRMLQ